MCLYSIRIGHGFHGHLSLPAYLPIWKKSLNSSHLFKKLKCRQYSLNKQDQQKTNVDEIASFFWKAQDYVQRNSWQAKSIFEIIVSSLSSICYKYLAYSSFFSWCWGYLGGHLVCCSPNTAGVSRSCWELCWVPTSPRLNLDVGLAMTSSFEDLSICTLWQTWFWNIKLKIHDYGYFS